MLTCNCENEVVDYIANLFLNGKQDGLIFVGNKKNNEEVLKQLVELYQRKDIIDMERSIFRSNCPLFMPLEFSTKVELSMDTNIIFYQREGLRYNVFDKFAVKKVCNPKEKDDTQNNIPCPPTCQRATTQEECETFARQLDLEDTTARVIDESVVGASKKPPYCSLEPSHDDIDSRLFFNKVIAGNNSPCTNKRRCVCKNGVQKSGKIKQELISNYFPHLCLCVPICAIQS